MSPTDKLISRLVEMGVVFTNGMPTTTKRFFGDIALAYETLDGKKFDLVPFEYRREFPEFFWGNRVNLCGGVRKLLASEFIVLARGDTPGELDVWPLSSWIKMKKLGYYAVTLNYPKQEQFPDRVTKED